MATRAVRLLCAAALCGCGSAAEPPRATVEPGTCPIAAPVAEPTFAGHILPALRLSCGAGTVICHGGTQGFTNGHVSYDLALSPAAVHASLVGASPSSAPAGYERVKAGDRAHSWLLAKVTEEAPGGGGGYGKRMPLGEPPLCPATVSALTSWIDGGAPLGP